VAEQIPELPITWLLKKLGTLAKLYQINKCNILKVHDRLFFKIYFRLMTAVNLFHFSFIQN